MNTFEQVNNKNVYTPLIRNKTFDYNSYLYKANRVGDTPPESGGKNIFFIASRIEKLQANRIPARNIRFVRELQTPKSFDTNVKFRSRIYKKKRHDTDVNNHLQQYNPYTQPKTRRFTKIHKYKPGNTS